MSKYDFTEGLTETTGVSVTLAVAALVFIFVLGAGYLGFQRWAAPEAESIRYDTYRESQAHRDGTAAHLSRLRLQYETAGTEAHRESFRRLAIAEADRYGVDRLPDDLAAWVSSLR